MRRHVIPFLILFAFVAAVIFVLFNSNWFLLKVIPPALAEYLKPLELQSLKIGKQQYRYPGTLVLKDVHFSLEQGFTQTDFSVDKIVFQNMLDIIKVPRKVRADVYGLKVDGQNFHLKNFDLQFLLIANEHSVKKVEGIFKGESAFFDLYHAERSRGRFNMDRQKIELLDIAAQTYGGEMKGQLWIDRQTRDSYIVWAELFRLKPEQLKEINSSIFSQVSGEFNGNFRMKDDVGSIEFLTGELSFVKGGEIGSSLLKMAASKSAGLNQEEAFQAITQGKPKIFFDEGKFYIQNTGLAKIILGVELKKTNGDLNIRAIHEIPTPDGLESFLFQGIKTDIFSKGSH